MGACGARAEVLDWQYEHALHQQPHPASFTGAALVDAVVLLLDRVVDCHGAGLGGDRALHHCPAGGETVPPEKRQSS